MFARVLYGLLGALLYAFGAAAPSVAGGASVPAAVERLLSPDSGYNPFPNADGSEIAYVSPRTSDLGAGWNERMGIRPEIRVVSPAGAHPGSPRVLREGFIEGVLVAQHRIVCGRYAEKWGMSFAGRVCRKVHFDTPDGERVRVAMLPDSGEVIWADTHDGFLLIRGEVRVVARVPSPLQLHSVFVVPSPDGRFIAALGRYDRERSNMWIYDRCARRWTDLHSVTVHGDARWDWMEAFWDPWLPDASGVVFIHDKRLYFSNPDGSGKVAICSVAGDAAIPAASPDGRSVAFVQSKPRPLEGNAEVRVFGGSRVWIVPMRPNARPLAVTQEVPEATFDLRWAGGRTLVFDRIPAFAPFEGSRIWTVVIPAP